MIYAITTVAVAVVIFATIAYCWLNHLSDLAVAAKLNCERLQKDYKELHGNLEALYWKTLTVRNMEPILDAVNERLNRLDASSGGYWHNGRGQVVRIRDMSDKHLENSLLYLDAPKHAMSPDRIKSLRRCLRSEIARRKTDAGWK